MIDTFDPAVIERIIDQLLRAAGGAAKRASLLTLIIVHPREKQAATAARLDYVFGRRPLRVIRIETGGGAPTSVDVAARCLPLQAGEEVCFQEIVFYNGPDNRALDPALWRPLVIRDLPAVLFWMADAAGLGDFSARLDFVPEKILVDSREQALDAARALVELTMLAGIAGSTGGVSDLAWRALAPLRRALARLFDPPEALAVLKDLTSVTMQGFDPGPSLIIGLWLAARLGLKRGRLNNSRLTWTDASGGPVVMTLATRSEKRFSVDFTAKNGGRAGLEQTAPGAVRLFAGGSERTEPWNAGVCDECLLEELDHLAPDRAWLELLAAARAMARD